MLTCAIRSVPLICMNKQPVVYLLYLSKAGLKTCQLNNLMNSLQLSHSAKNMIYKCFGKRAYLTTSKQAVDFSVLRHTGNSNVTGSCCHRTKDHSFETNTSSLDKSNYKCSKYSTCEVKNSCIISQIPKFCNSKSGRNFNSLESKNQAKSVETCEKCSSFENIDHRYAINRQKHIRNSYLCVHTHLLQNKHGSGINHQQRRNFTQFYRSSRKNGQYLSSKNKVLQSDSDISCVYWVVQKRTNYMCNWDGPEYRKQPPWRVLFFGTDLIALDTLTALHENMKGWSPVVGSLDVVTVKSQKPVREYAKANGLPIHNWPLKTDNSLYDVGILVSFGHMIPDRVIHMFPYGILNMHPSLLPRWRGASPIIHAVLSGDKEMGVSVTEIRPKHFDIGPILMQRGFATPPRPTSMQLADILGKIGANMILETLQDLPTLERFELEQDMSGVSYAHKISKQNGYINWKTSTAEEVDQHYRALSEIVPIRTMWKNQLVQLYDVVDPALLKDSKQYLHPRYKGDIDVAKPGTPVWHRKLDCIVIKCKDNLIGFKGLKLRKMLTPKDFHNGYLNAWDGTCFSSVDNELYKFVRSEKLPASSIS